MHIDREILTMNRSTDSRDSRGKLPSSLGSNASESPMTPDQIGDIDQPESHYEDSEPEDQGYQEPYQDDFQEPYNEDYEANYRTDYQADQQPEYGEAGSLFDTARDHEQLDVRQPRQPRRRAASPRGFLSSAAIAVGAIATIAGLFTAVVPEAAQLLNGLIAPETVTIIGLAIFVFATSHRHTSKLQHRLLENELHSTNADNEMRDTLVQITRRQSGLEFDTGESPDLQQLMLALQRQDQKVNNLTKAMKMYGNPLMEIASQSTELAGSSAQIKALVENSGQSTNEAISRLEKIIGTGTNTTGTNATGSDKLPEQFGKLQAALETMSQRPQDPELGKSLIRVEDAINNLSVQIQQQRRDAPHTTELQKSLQKAISEFSKGIAEMRDSTHGKLEKLIREIQRDLTGLTADMSQIQSTLKARPRESVNPSRATPESNFDSQPTDRSTIKKPEDQQGKLTHGTSGSFLASKTDENGYSTGPRKSSGKNVLGSIAKLKQMKG